MIETEKSFSIKNHLERLHFQNIFLLQQVLHPLKFKNYRIIISDRLESFSIVSFTIFDLFFIYSIVSSLFFHTSETNKYGLQL